MQSAFPSSAGRVTVVGSLNVDRIWRVARLPRPGETVFATETRLEFGGKGANQAVAAARHGAKVSMIGALGADADGALYREHLRREGVGEAAVAALSGVASGAAFICVDGGGENQILVDSGANGRLTVAQAEAALAALLPSCDTLLVGLECPLAVAVAALRAAARAGVRALFNPSPVVPEFPWGEVPIDTVIVNEHECAEIFGSAEATAPARRGVRHLVVTQGAAPTLFVSADGVRSIATHPVTPRDTVGAGDTFAGTLAARLAEGTEWGEAIAIANVAAALSTLGAGAQTPIPRRAEVEAAWRVVGRQS
ncbi:MAG: ribokinase [Verrucomicrobia bacterium]|nr:ribokinase [Verrucomicrobiota bacterium]